MRNRILETVKGYESAVAEIKIRSTTFNDLNGAGRMIVEPSGLSAWDNEGSGEFFKARCLNINQAESCAEEIYQIETCW